MISLIFLIIEMSGHTWDGITLITISDEACSHRWKVCRHSSAFYFTLSWNLRDGFSSVRFYWWFFSEWLFTSRDEAQARRRRVVSQCYCLVGTDLEGQFREDLRELLLFLHLSVFM